MGFWKHPCTSRAPLAPLNSIAEYSAIPTLIFGYNFYNFCYSLYFLQKRYHWYQCEIQETKPFHSFADSISARVM